MYKKIIFQVSLLFSLLVCKYTYAQEFSEKQIKQWEKNPDWITMMEDENANYFETIAAYEAFWKNHEMPVEEDQILRAPRDQKEKVESRSEIRKRKREERKMEKEEQEEAVLRHKYAFAVKKFKHWKITVEPYVQPDGRILSKAEQLKLHEQQR